MKDKVAYAMKHKNDIVREKSQSGGAFTAFSDLFLEQGGVVYGCIITEDLKVVHARAIDYELRDRMRGSKYVQSDMGNIFQQVKVDLEADRKVLFSGTPCQIAGLKSFLGRDYSNLFCVDIICHGVPSPLIYKNFLEFNEKKYGKCSSFNFRNKKYGWKSCIQTLEFSDRKRYRDSTNFSILFYSNLVLRPSCYCCPYAKLEHISDVTIGDCWGIESAENSFSDDNGVSLVLVHTEQGERVWQAITEDIEYMNIDINKFLQRSLIQPEKKPTNREMFWSDYKKYPFVKILNKYADYGMKAEIKRCIKRLLGKRLTYFISRIREGK